MDNSSNSAFNATNFTLTFSEDSCTYSGAGDFSPQCADNCTINSPIDLDGNDLIIQGNIGRFVVTSAINNVDRLIKGFNPTSTSLEDQCYVDIVNSAGGVIR